MILYVNGDSHTAAAEAVTPHAFAEDDPAVFYLGRAPHPDNLQVSWGKLLSLALRSGFHCDAESASSNSRIMRTTRSWLEDHEHALSDILVVIQWSTWEREEWLHNGTYYQVNASGMDDVPPELQEKYRNFVIGVDWQFKTEQAHKDIWDLHQELKEKGIKHVFFNGNSDFGKITDRLDWGVNYVDPYDPKSTFSAIVQARGCQTVSPNSWHFGRDAHSYFNRYLLNYIITNQII